MNYTFDYDKGVLTIAENGRVIFQQDFFYEPVADRSQKIMDAIYEYTEIPNDHIEEVLDEIMNFGYISVDL